MSFLSNRRWCFGLVLFLVAVCLMGCGGGGTSQIASGPPSLAFSVAGDGGRASVAFSEQQGMNHTLLPYKKLKVTTIVRDVDDGSGDSYIDITFEDPGTKENIRLRLRTGLGVLKTTYGTHGFFARQPGAAIAFCDGYVAYDGTLTLERGSDNTFHLRLKDAKMGRLPVSDVEGAFTLNLEATIPAVEVPTGSAPITFYIEGGNALNVVMLSDIQDVSRDLRPTKPLTLRGSIGSLPARKFYTFVLEDEEGIEYAHFTLCEAPDVPIVGKRYPLSGPFAVAPGTAAGSLNDYVPSEGSLVVEEITGTTFRVSLTGVKMRPNTNMYHPPSGTFTLEALLTFENVQPL